MKTDDLVAMLANGPIATAPNETSRRIRLALLIGAPLSMAILVAGYGLRDDLLQIMAWPMFWVKLLFPLSVAVFALVAVHRLARPGVRVRRVWLGMVVPVLLIWALALSTWLNTPIEARLPSLLGHTWRTCVFNIGLLALPVFVATVVALRSLAPTRPALAGAAAGALASGVGAAFYALHCEELAIPFLAVWYVIGMVLPVAVGALLGRRLLRW